MPFSPSSPSVEDQSRSLLELLYHVSREVATALDLRTVLQRVLSEAISFVGGEHASLVVFDDDGKPVDATIVHGQQYHEHATLQIQEIVERGLAGWVVRNRQAVLIPDTSRDERWLRRPDEVSNQAGGKSAICVPLLVREQLVGALTLVHSTPNAYSNEQLELMQAIADLVGTTIQNATFYDRIDAARQRYRELFEDNIDPILITDWYGKILEANRQAAILSGWSEDELRTRSIDTIHTINRECTGTNYDNLRKGAPGKYESILHCKEGGVVPVEVNVRRVKLEQTDSLQWMLHDITERRELDSLREDMAAMIYHDLRSPLGNIVSSLAALEGMVDENDTSLQSVLGIATHSTARIQRLVDSLLDLNRLEAGHPVTNRKVTDPIPLVQQAIQDVTPAAEGRRQKLISNLPAYLPPLMVDPGMAQRVLINLLENAIKFTPAGGRIELDMKETGDGLEFRVSDDGPGIAPEEQELIFKKFTRLRRSSKIGGTGVGLAFCRLAVQGHGGRIWVESQPDKGATFHFTLPFASQEQVTDTETIIHPGESHAVHFP